MGGNPTERPLPNWTTAFRNREEDAPYLSGGFREPIRNVRDRLATLLSVSSPLTRQTGGLVPTLGS